MPPTSAYKAPEPPPAPPTAQQQLKPVLDLLAKGEGNYDSVNRGWAGDTMGGMTSLTGRHLTSYTVGQVMDYQNGWLYAVGRYQLIPSTMRVAVRDTGIPLSTRFTPAVQDELAIALIEHKRPAVYQYVTGAHDSLGWALDEAAKEWAAVEYRHGRGYYDGWGGNRARVSRVELAEVLQDVKSTWQP